MARPHIVTRVGIAAAAASLGLGGLTASAAQPAHPNAWGANGQVLLVCSGTARCPSGGPYYPTIQSAVNAAANGDWILVWPGLYQEDVTVTPTAKLTSDLWIRGMNRNGVLLDGSYSSTSDHGVYVNGVNNTWVENMSAQNYQHNSGNAFWWNGVDGYWGNYLTAYNNGNYGIYAYNSTNSTTPGSFAYDYSSWNSDSGIYIGDCTDCNAVITYSHAEYNAIGYSGTNAGGELYITNTEWDHNLSGIVPNTLVSEPSYPQRGAVIENNYVHDNNDGEVPGAGIAAIAPLGVGIELAGGQQNIVRNNVVSNEEHYGVLVHWLMTPAMDNVIDYNTFNHVGYGAPPDNQLAPVSNARDADIGIEAASPQNCVQGNIDTTSGTSQPATTDPPDVAGLQQCKAGNPTAQNCPVAGEVCIPAVYEPGDPVLSALVALNAAGVTEPRAYNGPGPQPEAQNTMANPCDGVPNDPWCSNGKPVNSIPTSPGTVPPPINGSSSPLPPVPFTLPSLLVAPARPEYRALRSF
jgi:hypothetical protein